MIPRIFLPFVVVFALLSGLTLWWSASSVNSLIEREYWARTERVTKLLSSRPYLLTSSVISQLEELTDSGIAIYNQQGRPMGISSENINSRTIYDLFPELPEELLRRTMSGSAPHKQIFLNAKNQGRIFFRPVALSSSEKVIVAVLVSDAPLLQLRKDIMWSIGINGIAGMVMSLGLVLFLSHIFNRNFKLLLLHMEDVARGNLECRLPVSGLPEWQRLASAFNNMVERLITFQRKLKESERLAAAGELSLSLAHEVRNPLTAIKMTGQVLKKRFAQDASSARLIDVMLREIERINSLVKDIMTWNRPAAANMVQISLNDLVSEVVELMTPAMERAGLTLQWNSGTLPLVDVDPAQIKQVLWNLLHNARKVSKTGDVIKISTAREDEGWVIISVEDQGHGINEGAEKKLFKPFFSTSVSGLGLGLSICEHIATVHNGRITIENRETGGVRAVLWLPISERDKGAS